jgi:hypothetical protein
VLGYYTVHGPIYNYNASTAIVTFRVDTMLNSISLPSDILGHEHLARAAERKHNRHKRTKSIICPILRVLLTVLAVVGASVVPSFESVLSLSGSALCRDATPTNG